MSTRNLFKVAEVEITYKNPSDLLQRPKVTQTNDVINIMRNIECMNKHIDYKEIFYAIYMNQGSRVLSVGKISEGTTTSCPVDIRHIMQSAILQNATGLVLCHNHPSEDIEPSRQDKQLTSAVKDAAMIFGIKLIDSVIISSHHYFSFLESGLI
jgi:DNA repair protein RadC